MIVLSAKESEVVGVRIGRGMLSKDWQPNALLEQMLAMDIDFARVKIPSTDEQVFEKLDQLQMPYTIHSILVRNSIDLSQEELQEQLSSDLRFELFDGSEPERMKDLVRRSWGERTAVNYHNRLFREWVSYDTEKEGSAAYSLEFDHTKDPNKLNWLIWKGGDLVGFVLGDVEHDHFEGVMYSVLPEYRGLNIARNIMIFLKGYCKERGLKYFKNDVVFQNIPSLKSIVTKAIDPVDTYLNVTIAGLLNASKVDKRAHELTGLSFDQAQQWVLAHVAEWLPANKRIDSVKFKLLDHSPMQLDKVDLSFPVMNNEQELILLKLKEQEEVKALVYIDAINS